MTDTAAFDHRPAHLATPTDTDHLCGRVEGVGRRRPANPDPGPGSPATTATLHHRPAHPTTGTDHPHPTPPTHPLGDALRNAHTRAGARVAVTTPPAGPSLGSPTPTATAALRHRPAHPATGTDHPHPTRAHPLGDALRNAHARTGARVAVGVRTVGAGAVPEARS
ncbi:hypothetical protein RKD29_003850 [Streptomyces tendae]